MKQIISTPNAPKALAPYSQAIKVGQMVYLSGQIGVDPKTMQVVSGGIAAQTTQMFQNLKAVAEAAGGSLEHVVKITGYITDIAYYSEFNDVMRTFYPNNAYPARILVAIQALPLDALVAADAIMALPS